MIHDNIALRVSEEEATKFEEEAKRRLIASKRLSLVVDLDQTIIHATVDKTVKDWMEDTEHPNHEAVKDVRTFRLVDNGSEGCVYYIKLRPGLKNFLESMSQLYELHVYTAATRPYAQNVAKLIDPDRKLFGDRILSRDESGNIEFKFLQRLFPVDTKMVVIIDDRADVWSWNSNLLKVTPYAFYVGVGDINSSFLPKKPKIKVVPKTEVASSANPNDDLARDSVVPDTELPTEGKSSNPAYRSASGSDEVPAGGNRSALEQLFTMGGGGDPSILQAQKAKQEEALVAQMQDRPLLQKQKELEAEEEAEAAKPYLNGDNASASDMEHAPRPRHPLLVDNDTELYHLEQALRTIHTAFFDTYTRNLGAAQGGRIAELRPTLSHSKFHRPRPSPNMDLAVIPDIKTLMPSLKSHVLAGINLVFSGVVPIGVDVQKADIAIWAKSFGATVSEEISRRTTTHLIAARNRTAKVRQAVRKGRSRIKIVGTHWLLDSIVQWKRLDETPYQLKTDDGEAGKALPDERNEPLSESEDIDTFADTDTDMTETETSNEKVMPGTRLTIRTENAIDDEDMENLLPSTSDGEHSPIGGTNKDWKEMHDEMAEFLGSENEDSDGESTNSTESGFGTRFSRNGNGVKRSFDAMAGEENDRAGGRKKPSGKGLATVLITSSEAGPKDGWESSGVNVDEEVDGNVVDDGWSDFEGDLEAEMERAAKEERGEE